MFAIAARNVIALMNHYQRLEQHEGKSLGAELVVQGSGDRLSPILTTAFATGLALLPFMFLGSRAGLEIVHPMALVVLGGLVTSTLLSLFVVPALYFSFGGGPRAAMTPEDELMHRWAGVTPEVAAAPAGANGDPVPAEPQVPDWDHANRWRSHDPRGRSPTGQPDHSGADAGNQPRGDE